MFFHSEIPVYCTKTCLKKASTGEKRRNVYLNYTLMQNGEKKCVNRLEYLIRAWNKCDARYEDSICIDILNFPITVV